MCVQDYEIGSAWLYMYSVHLKCMCIMYICSCTDETWEIDKSELTLGRELGSGQFGVRLVLRLSTVKTQHCVI